MKQHCISCEIAVIGGGPAGIAAAVTAARAGRRVLLIEKNGYLGGAQAIGLSPLGFLDKKGRRCIDGFAGEFMARLAARGDSLGTCVCPKHNSATCVNAEGVKILALELCRESGVEVLLHCETLRVEREGTHIRRVVMYGKCNEVAVEAKIYIDCTGDGDVAYLAGSSYEMGLGETGVLQPPTVMFTLENVDQEALFAYVETHPEELRYNDEAIYEDPRYTVQHFRDNKSHVFVGLQATFRRWKAEGRLPVERTSFIYINGTHPGEVYINSIRITQTDATDLISLTRAETEGMLQINPLVDLLRAEVPGFADCFVSSIAPSIGVRETRRFAGIKTVTEQDVRSAHVPEDTICLSGYKVDIHSGTGTGLLFSDVEEPFGIPYGALVSRDMDNLLLAGRCISADSFALGSLRVIPTCMAMGQAAGVAACLSNEMDTTVVDVDVQRLRERLIRQGTILSLD